MSNVMLCKRCGDDLGLKYEGTIELSDITKEYFYQQINKIDEIATKLNNCRSIISICAEKLLDDESGALWAAYDIIKGLESELDERFSALMQVYQEATTKKAKKK